MKLTIIFECGEMNSCACITFYYPRISVYTDTGATISQEIAERVIPDCCNKIYFDFAHSEHCSNVSGSAACF
jgi:hypothetical protein